MVTAEMWWGESHRDGEGGIVITHTSEGDLVTGRVYQPNEWFPCCRFSSILSQYFLQPHRMPEDGCVFTSKPVVRLTGDMKAKTGDCIRLGIGILGFDLLKPTAACTFSIQQYVYSGDERIGHTLKKIDAAYIWEECNKHRTHYFDPVVEAEPFSFELDRRRTLEIDVQVGFGISTSMSGKVFTPAKDSSVPLYVRIPQWSIVSEY